MLTRDQSMTPKISSNTSIPIMEFGSKFEGLLVFHAHPYTGHPVTSRVGPTEKFWFKLILWLNLVAGNGFRILVFRAIGRQGFSRVPINLMIAIDEGFKVNKDVIVV